MRPTLSSVLNVCPIFLCCPANQHDVLLAPRFIFNVPVGVGVGAGEGVLLYGSPKRLAALCFALFSENIGSTNLCPSELVALGLDESGQSYVRGVALSREQLKI